MSRMFESTQLGQYELKHRVVMGCMPPPFTAATRVVISTIPSQPRLS